MKIKEIVKRILIIFCVGSQMIGTVKVVGDLIHEYYKPVVIK